MLNDRPGFRQVCVFLKEDENMGLLSKIFGDDETAQKAKEIFGGLINAAAANNAEQKRSDDPVIEENRRQAALSGESWGDEMPAEENQYNYGGTYIQYFENIFNTDFAEYRTEKATADRRTIYTFFSGASKALVVELMPESSSVYKLRKECEKAGVPYLRFYYDHDGWWNTRSYVKGRIVKALKA